MTKKNRKLTGKRLDTFEKFWSLFNYKKDKASAADAWLNIPVLDNSLVNKILAAAKIEAERRPALKKNGLTPKMAQGWISSRRWEDEDTDDQPKTIKVPVHFPTLGDKNGS